MPGIAFAPVALLLFGFSLEMELMVIVLPALWPVLINTMGAVMGVHARLFEVGRTFRLSRSRDHAQDHVAGGAAGRAGRRAAEHDAWRWCSRSSPRWSAIPRASAMRSCASSRRCGPELVFAYVVAIGALGMILNAVLTGAVAILFPAASGLLREAA